ncbi:hypothetical protein [Pseudarthrobacter sp. ATCC 49987]|uniref:hypothetical protein n=1 Tax=Pseudarthrobacter sp. ATCC 49987 TaxID=2698204 RepID=UPI001F2EB84E|nr:hypothetical protein [Pseudarthrobacter sp. ATCC 49987]
MVVVNVFQPDAGPSDAGEPGGVVADGDAAAVVPWVWLSDAEGPAGGGRRQTAGRQQQDRTEGTAHGSAPGGAG